MNELHPAGSALGRLALAIALEEQAAGAKEVGQNNSGPWVQKYLFGQARPPQPWCAAFVSWCFHEAAVQLNRDLPFTYTLGARELFSQLPITLFPAPGDVVGWWRGTADGSAGHVGIVLDVSPQRILTALEGNHGRFPVGIRTLSYVMEAPQFTRRLLGFGRVT